MQSLSDEELVIIKRSLQAHASHLQNERHIPEISHWLDKVTDVQHKVTNLLLERSRELAKQMDGKVTNHISDAYY